MTVPAQVIDRPVSFDFPQLIVEMINNEDYFGRKVRNIDDAEATIDESGRITGVTFHKMSNVDPKKGIALQFERALKFLMRHLPFPDLL